MSQIQPATRMPQSIGQMIEAQISAIAMVVSGSTPNERRKRAEKFARICLTAVRNTPHLNECSMPSLAAAMMTSAQLDLEPNTPQGLAYLIPYKGKRGYEAQFQVGYKGLLQLAYRSGMVQSINADVVYRAEIEAGLFSYTKGACPNIVHETDLLGDYRKGDIVAAYAACTLKGGQTIMRVIDRQDVERAQKTSASFQAANRFGKPGMSPWHTSPDAMWMKTAIKRLAAWMPQVEILSRALEEDSKADRDTIEASGKSEAEAINEAIAASSVPLPGAQNDADADSSTESDSATQAGAHDATPATEPPQEQAAAFIPPYQTFTCPHKGAQITEDDCYDCKHRTGCPHWEAAPAADA